MKPLRGGNFVQPQTEHDMKPSQTDGVMTNCNSLPCLVCRAQGKNSETEHGRRRRNRTRTNARKYCYCGLRPRMRNCQQAAAVYPKAPVRQSDFRAIYRILRSQASCGEQFAKFLLKVSHLIDKFLYALVHGHIY